MNNLALRVGKDIEAWKNILLLKTLAEFDEMEVVKEISLRGMTEDPAANVSR